MKSASNRSASMQKRFKKIYIIIPAILAVLAASALAVLYMNGFFYNRRDVQVKVNPSGDEITALVQNTKIIPADMLSRSLSLLRDKTKTSPYIISWYALPGNISTASDLESEYLVTEDQVNLLRYYISKGKKDSAETLADAIEKNFSNENGYLVPGRKAAEISSLAAPQPVFPGNAGYEDLPSMTPYSMEATVEYIRALLEYYQKWGTSSDWARIEKLASLLYTDDSGFADDMTVDLSATPVPTGENQDIVSAVDGQVATGGTFKSLTLSSLDLQVFRMLSNADTKYQPLYDRAAEILSGAMISEDLPLFAIGYTQDSGGDGYVYYSGKDTVVDLVSSLKITLYLAEEGKAPQSTILWIKEQLYNQGMLYKNYDLISGQAATTEESIESYGILLQIARAVDDADLYSKALDRLEYHLATSSTSKARSAIFRQLDGTRVVVYAKDNLEALLGV